jgi:hypothetical protein
LERITRLNDAQEHDNDRDHEQDVNGAAERVGRPHAKQPQKNKDESMLMLLFR